jgi:hypothetical protein
MNDFLVIITLLFIPGILGAIICDKITFHRKWSSFKFSIHAFILGVFSYFFVQLFITALDVINYFQSGTISWRKLDTWNAIIFDQKLLSFSEIVSATFAAIPVAMFVSWMINLRMLNKLAWNIGISTKYGDDNLFSYKLNESDFSWVYIRDFKNNITYMGQISAYSETAGLQEIVLCKAQVYRYEDSAHIYDSPNIYLSIIPGSVVIEAISPDNLEKVNG